jgi:macrolide-specific efflux system membrane fusion protein
MSTGGIFVKKLVALVILTLLIGGGGFYWSQRSREEEHPPPKAVLVSRGDIVVAVEATGTVQPENRLVIKPPINGRIDSVSIAEGRHVRRGEILATMSSTDRAALLDAARSSGPEEVKHWEDIYRPTPIVAPMTGVIIARSVEPGQTISAQDNIFVMSDRLMIVAQVDETDMAKIHVGQRVDATVDAYASEQIQGKVHQIAYEARTVSNVTMYDVKILPTKEADFMRSGMSASVKFIIKEERQVLMIPVTAMKPGEAGQATVLVPAKSAPPQSPPELRSVSLGLSDGRMVEVRSGLTAGETILEEGLNFKTVKRGLNPFMPMGGGRSGPPGRSK